MFVRAGVSETAQALLRSIEAGEFAKALRTAAQSVLVPPAAGGAQPTADGETHVQGWQKPRQTPAEEDATYFAAVRAASAAAGAAARGNAPAGSTGSRTQLLELLLTAVAALSAFMQANLTGCVCRLQATGHTRLSRLAHAAHAAHAHDTRPGDHARYWLSCRCYRMRRELSGASPYRSSCNGQPGHALWDGALQAAACRPAGPPHSAAAAARHAPPGCRFQACSATSRCSRNHRGKQN